MTDQPADLAGGALGDDTELGRELARVVAIMARLRRDCPWDAAQTHRSLAKHLIEETAETIDAIEAGSDTDLVEELGDLLLQVMYHSEIARTEGRFDIDDVADGIVDKLIVRHPYIFDDAAVPTDMMATWEGAKRVEKQRQSALDGIADSLSALSRAAKVATRLNDTHADAAFAGLAVADEPLDTQTVGQGLLTLVTEAVRAGIDPDQALRDATREWELRVRQSGV